MVIDVRVELIRHLETQESTAVIVADLRDGAVGSKQALRELPHPPEPPLNLRVKRMGEPARPLDPLRCRCG